jgi:hypothetical protein
MNLTALNDHKIKDYNNLDPRYNLTIGDSSEYNKEIMPFQLKKVCHKDGEVCDVRKMLDIKYPPISRCWAQRYENCISVDQIDQMHKETCTECHIEVQKPEDIKEWRNIKGMRTKNINNNTFYDQHRISRINHPNITVDRSPDILEGFDQTDQNLCQPNIDRLTIFMLTVIMAIIVITRFR